MKDSRSKREKVDSLIDQLWNSGYLTLSRKYGKYLPAPAPVGNYEVDAVAKYKKKIALGLALTEDELNDPNLVNKLKYLANTKTKFSTNKVTLFVGVPSAALLKAHMLLSSLDEETQSKIKIVSLPENVKKPE